MYCLSVIVPLLLLLFIYFKYIAPLLNEDQLALLGNVFSYGLSGVFGIALLSFFPMFSWVKSIENVTAEAKAKFAEILPQGIADDMENEAVILQRIVDDLYRDLNAKVETINEYSKKLIASNRQLSHMSITDGLTGLYNRRYLDSRLPEEISRALRYQHGLAFIMIDVDNFKQYNDTNGHQAGDDLLKNLAMLIKKAARKTDIAFRYGGDEFAVIVPQSGFDEAKIIAERIQTLFGSRQEISGSEEISLSFGISVDREKAEDYIEEADRWLYGEKNIQKN